MNLFAHLAILPSRQIERYGILFKEMLYLLLVGVAL